MNLLSCGCLWLYFGAFLMLTELAAPGFVIFFFGLSSVTVGVLCLIFGESFGGTWQLAAFSVFTVFYLVFLRRILKDMLVGRRENRGANFDVGLVGRHGSVTEAIDASSPGRVIIGDAEWTAVADTSIAIGVGVTVISQDNLTIKVKEAK